MKKHIVLSCALAVTASAAFAAMGANFGLPKNWSMTTAAETKGYGAITGIAGNPGSAMCVECHTVNPSDRIPSPSDTRGLDFIDETGTAYLGSHVVMNAAVATDGIDGTNTGGGFTGSVSGPRNGGQYLPAAVWAAATASGGESKFNLETTANTNGLQSVLRGGSGYDAAAAGMICESCHSVRYNMGNQLLLDDYADNGNSDICVGCHKAMHTAGNLKAFDGSSTKRHHVLTSDVLQYDATHYKGGGTASLMWAPTASDRLDPRWCEGGTPGPYGTFAGDPSFTLVISATASEAIAFRDACNVAGSGTLAASATRGDINVADTATDAPAQITCANCHRPHNAMTGAGAFILRSGQDNATSSPTDFVDYAGKTAGSFTSGSVYYGIRRQNDVGDYTADKVYGEYLPLCVGCHKGYGE